MDDEEPVPLTGSSLRPAGVGDVAELLVLQRCCWVSEAILNDTLAIPALHENEQTIQAWVEDKYVWIVRRGPRLVAAIRAHQDGQRWEIGRLMVAPDLQSAGLGRWLLAYAESRAPGSVRDFDLFTGGRSERNVRMYQAAGYELTWPPGDRLGQHISGAVFLTKHRDETSPARAGEAPAGS
ncbi:N-acetyltransferase [Pseudonocardia sp. KRD291]|uniref:GNAT family N-acetyltransferase n=1 Tax=Pseudonocardia sp. KRD291 TaxID=2792007 RepID=UPI001C4A2DB4|nr:GNAT family N-acetyltransferase [Pseudonocardia sp. KRD291]MBW0104311.1 GNAT family N-acetyltransferase [Pseudonocardia sp. KRD291]